MRRRPAMLVLIVVFFSAFGVAACGGLSEEQAPEEGQAQERTLQEEQTEGEGKEKPREKQRATYYGEELADSPTASGELYDPSGFTAAHKQLPFGTVVEVCYHDCTQVTVNDRNPNSTEDLDLSLAAADRIGLTPDGQGVVDAGVVEDELSSQE